MIHKIIGYIVYDTYKEKFYAKINEYLGLKSGAPYIESAYCDNNKTIWIKPYDKSTHQK